MNPTESPERPVIGPLSGFNPDQAVDLSTLKEGAGMAGFIEALGSILKKLEDSATTAQKVILSPQECGLLLSAWAANSEQIIYLLDLLEATEVEAGTDV